MVLIGLPVLVLLCYLAVPGAMASFQAPAPTFALRYLVGYVLILLLGGPLGEEPGWRGLALPRLQQCCGSLVGSLVLGVLWGLWHLPAFFLIPGYNGAGSGFVGIISAFIPYVIATMALAIIYTWISNNTRGSLFLAILFHASFNSAGSMFATFFPPAISESLLAQVIEEGVFVGVALLLIVATRGQLSYQHLLRETESPEKLGLSSNACQNERALS
jgi:membrane protease YdiL (CAAX protease family)